MLEERSFSAATSLMFLSGFGTFGALPLPLSNPREYRRSEGSAVVLCRLRIVVSGRVRLTYVRHGERSAGDPEVADPAVDGRRRRRIDPAGDADDALAVDRTRLLGHRVAGGPQRQTRTVQPGMVRQPSIARRDRHNQPRGAGSSRRTQPLRSPRPAAARPAHGRERDRARPRRRPPPTGARLPAWTSTSTSQARPAVSDPPPPHRRELHRVGRASA